MSSRGGEGWQAQLLVVLRVPRMPSSKSGGEVIGGQRYVVLGLGGVGEPFRELGWIHAGIGCLQKLDGGVEGDRRATIRRLKP